MSVPMQLFRLRILRSSAPVAFVDVEEAHL